MKGEKEEKPSSDLYLVTDEESAFISILVVNLDYILVKQSVKEDLGRKEASPNILEPVIRIFGSTPYGQRTCVHLHGVTYLIICSSQIMLTTFTVLSLHLFSTGKLQSSNLRIRKETLKVSLN
jgi:hypothetical protein